MRFEFATASRIIFGCRTVRELSTVTRELGSRVLVVTGRNQERIAPIIASLTDCGLMVQTFAITGEPTTHEVEKGSQLASDSGSDIVIGIGGGSAVDAGKAIAAMSSQPSSLLDYLEVIGQGRALEEKPLPYIAVPTTAGTGAEVTRNAVLSSPDHGVKVSLRHAWMLPAVALIDPELAVPCPSAVTAASGMDALTQCLEAYVSCRAQPMTDALCVEGIRRTVRSLEKAVKEGSDLAAREDMALAALFSGMALANAGLGAVHGFAAPIGGMFHAPHGAVCAALLAPVWNANWKALQTKGDSVAITKFRNAAQILLNDPNGTPEKAGDWLQALTSTLQIPQLSAYGLVPDDLDGLVGKGARASSMKGNPVALMPEEMRSILCSAL